MLQQQSVTRNAAGAHLPAAFLGDYPLATAIPRR